MWMIDVTQQGFSIKLIELQLSTNLLFQDTMLHTHIHIYYVLDEY